MENLALFGFFNGNFEIYWWLLTIAVGLTLGFRGWPLWAWTVLGLVVLIVFGAAPIWLGLFIVLALIFNLSPLRSRLISASILKAFKAFNFIPKISATERTALDAGVVWVEGELFSGRPNLQKLMDEPYSELTPEEKAFVEGPVEELCKMIDEEKVWQEKDLPKPVWDYFKKEKFLGMVIPKEYGGLGFSAMAHGEVIMKLATRSIPTCISVMVPNSLGPAELLTHYGTDAQKKKWLPRLATGEELPCFALTEPNAGSDAGSIESSGELYKGDDGRLYIRLNWNKRWITLAAVSSLIGMAFRLRDPQNLLGKGEDVGITCALIPAATPGVVLGKRHDPLGVPFYNCPTTGDNVVVPADESIIGGLEWAGRGWQMLMESLAAGRGVSLPAQSAGGCKLSARVAGAHGVVRKQFGVSIGKFEGLEEPMAYIGASAYLLDAVRRYTCGAIDKGIKPPVVTAIAKYNTTEIFRRAINHAMDVQGGAAISLGPRNLLGRAYIAAPIGITVEGANIMTRTLIIFGQGAMRAHPYAYKEVNAVEKSDLSAFDKAFWGHIGHIVRNAFRSILLSLTRGRLATSPVEGKAAPYFRRLAWTSASFAIMADIAMGSLGGSLKMKEKITGRFADILSWMYMITATLRRFEAEGRRSEDWPFVQYVMEHGFTQIQEAFDGIFGNIPVPGLSWFFRGPIRFWSRLNAIGSGVTDKTSHKVAQAIQEPGEVRDRLTHGVFVNVRDDEGLGRLERAFITTKQAEEIERKIRNAIRSRQLPKKQVRHLVDEAIAKNIISSSEAKVLQQSIDLRNDAIQVDSFGLEEYKER